MKVFPTVRLIVEEPNNEITGGVVSTLPLGQVPQTGLLSSVRAELNKKFVGSELMLETHHHEMF